MITAIEYTDHDTERICKPEALSPEDERSEFERDRSRIIHSSAFRRLQGKTQVFTAGEGDFLRTRLTHSLEVAQIGKGLARRLGANPELVEAISLLHDIGHPPFGHAGEDELKRLMKPYGGFEANAQNIRVVTRLESKSTDCNGLNLTRAVIDGQMKYKQTMSENLDKFVYTDDLDIVRWASQEAIESIKGVGLSSRSFECEIMEWADDVAYAVHDLEDSIHAHYVDRSLLNPINDRTQAAIADVQECFSNLDLHQIHAGLSTFITDFIGEWNEPQPASATLGEQKMYSRLFLPNQGSIYEVM